MSSLYPGEISPLEKSSTRPIKNPQSELLFQVSLIATINATKHSAPHSQFKFKKSREPLY